MTPAEVVGFAFALIVAGTETTTNLIGNAMLALARSRRAPRSSPPIRRLASAVVEETFRLRLPRSGTGSRHDGETSLSATR